MTSLLSKAVSVLLLFALQISAALPKEKINLRFVSSPKISRAVPVELLVGENETITVQTPSNELSPVYKVNSMDNWVVGETTTGEKGEPAFTVFGKSEAAESSEQLILIARKGSDHSDGLTLFTIDYRTDEFEGGDFIFINTSDLDIEGIIGGKKIAIKPGQISQVTPDPSDKSAARKSFQTQLFYRNDNQMKPFFSTTWPLNPKARSLIFFYNSPHNNGLKIHTVQDFTP